MALQPEQSFLAHTLFEHIIYAVVDADPIGCHVYAFLASTGVQLWRSELMADPVFDSPLRIGKRIFCVGVSSVFALDADSGELLWTHFVGTTNYLQACVEDETLYLCLRSGYQQMLTDDELRHQKDGALLALSVIDGSVRWWRDVVLRPTMFHVKHGVFYVRVDQRNDLYAFDAENGSALWHTDPVIDPAQTQLMIQPGFGSSLIVTHNLYGQPFLV